MRRHGARLAEDVAEGALRLRLRAARQLFSAQIFSGMRVRVDDRTAFQQSWRCRCGGKLVDLRKRWQKARAMRCRGCGRHVDRMCVEMAGA